MAERFSSLAGRVFDVVENEDAFSIGRQSADQGGQGGWQVDRCGAEGDPGAARADLDLVEAQGADAGGGLGVEGDEQIGDAVFGGQRVVV